MRKLSITLVLAVGILGAHASRAPVRETVETAKGTVIVSSSHEVTPKSLGLPMYRGAKIVDGSEYLVKTDSGELAQMRVQAKLRTKAPLRQVERFYSKALQGGGSRFDKPAGRAILWKSGGGKVWIVTITEKTGQPTSIEIRHAAKYKPVAAEYPDRRPPGRRRPTDTPRSA